MFRSRQLAAIMFTDIVGYTALMDEDEQEAFELLKKNRQVEFRGVLGGWHDFILVDPFFESLRDDPEFKAIVKQAQEEKAALREQVGQMEERGELTL